MQAGLRRSKTSSSKRKRELKKRKGWGKKINSWGERVGIDAQIQRTTKREGPLEEFNAKLIVVGGLFKSHGRLTKKKEK